MYSKHAEREAREALAKSHAVRQYPEDPVAASDASNQDAAATPGPSNSAPVPTDTAADLEAAMSSRPAAEREAAMNLVAFATQQPSEQDLSATRIGVLIEQLVENAPQGGLDERTEIQHLQSLQELINRRMQALASSDAPPPSN